MNIERIRSILDSVLVHIQSTLTDLGYSDTDQWVKRGYIQPETSPPAVAVSYGSGAWSEFETGSLSLEDRIRVRVDIYASTATQLEDLMAQIANNLEPMRIINFNTAMPGDAGYDAEAQTIAWAFITDIAGVILDPLEHTARVNFLLRPDRPIVLT